MDVIDKATGSLSSVGKSIKNNAQSGLFIDTFIPPQLQKSRDSAYKSRVLVALLLTCTALLFLVMVYFILFTPSGAAFIRTTFVMTMPLVVVFVATLILFRYTGRYLLCCHVMVAVGFIAVTVGVYISGGPVDSPATYLVPVPALLAFCLMGKKNGLLWAVLIFLVQILMVVVMLVGYQYPSNISPSHAPINTAVDWSIAYVLMIAIVIVYESMQTRLKDELNSERERMTFMATHDSLTSLPNRVLFYDRLQSSFYRARRHDDLCAVLYLDLNGFKPINDEYGHNAGDKVLVEVALRLAKNVRGEDTVARLGGDEFAILCERLESRDNAILIAEKVGRALSKVIEYEAESFSVSASIGIVTFANKEDFAECDQLVNCADQAMYQAKEGGLPYVVYGEELEPSHQR